MKSLLDYFKKDPVGDFYQGQALNDANGKRNWIILGLFSTLAGGVYLAGDYFMAPPVNAAVKTEVIDFGAVIDSDFTEKDNQSALTAQQIALDTQQRTIDKLLKTMEGIERNNHTANLDLKRNFESFQQVVTEKIESQIEVANNANGENLGLGNGTDPLGLGSATGFPDNGSNQNAIALGQYSLPILSPPP